MVAKFGFIISLIAGILIILTSIIALVFPISSIQSLSLQYFTDQNIYQPSLWSTIIGLITGAIIIYSSIQMKKEGHEKKAGKVVILFSIINLFIIGVSSLISLIGSIFGIIGGILAIMIK